MALGRTLLMEMLVAQGVEHLFGNPGTTEAPFMRALEGYPQLRYILGLQEAAVMGMADGYARAGGRTACVNLHITAGLANGLSGLYNAYQGGTPLVVTAGQADTRLYHEEPALYADLVGMARPFTKWSAEVAHAADIPMLVRRAFKVALEPPTGPVFLSLPMDALDEGAEADRRPLPPSDYRPQPDPAAIAQATGLLAAAERPLILAGDRAAQAGAVAELVQMAELLGAHVITVDPSELIFPSDHPLFAGSVSPWSPMAREPLHQADVILAVGATLFKPFMYAPRDALRPPTRLIHLDSSAWEISRIYPADIALLGDPRGGLRALAQALTPRLTQAQRTRAAERIAAGRQEQAERRARLEADLYALRAALPIAPLYLMGELAAALPQGALVVDEALTSSGPLRRAIKFREPRSFFFIRGGAIGWGMGATVGAALARPDRRVVGVIGDGSALYTLQSLWTAAHYRIPATFVICNNASYRILKVNLLRYLGEGAAPPQFIGLDLDAPQINFAHLATGLGVRAWRVERPQDLRPILETALRADEPTLVDVMIDGRL